jgi:aspartate racemase
MKTLGLIGGMSWESTAPYYRLINETVRDRLGGLHSAKIVLYSVDFHEIEVLQRAGDWDEAGRQLAEVAAKLQAAGADALVICTNTMHCVAPAIEAAVSIPLLHIADATGEAIRQAGLRRVALLGTRFTMEKDFYKGRLRERFDIEAIVPDQEDRDTAHRIIYEELCRGVVSDASRDAFRRIIGKLVEQGAEGVIFGCTEISLLVGQQDSPVPVFDTTHGHAVGAAEWAVT